MMVQAANSIFGTAYRRLLARCLSAWRGRIVPVHATAPALRQMARQRRAAVSVLFAAAAVPVVGVAGLAVDFTVWNEADSAMALAANVAALNAVKIAGSGLLANDSNAIMEGQTAGRGWFLASIGKPYATASITPTVNVTINGTTVTAQVSFTSNVNSVFGGLLFGIKYYNAAGSATASIVTAPYLNVEILVDNSSSMDIGATTSDIQTLMSLSVCDPSNAEYPDPVTGSYANANASVDDYSNYQYTYNGLTYDGTISTPFQAVVGSTSQTFYPVPPLATFSPSPACTLSNAVTKQVTEGGKTYTVAPHAGPPCAFACHWDTSTPAGKAVNQYNDLYGMARRTLGTSQAVTLRIDTVKTATNEVIDAMQADNLSINNLKVGIFSFNTQLTQVYPQGGEAGNDWATAKSDVGTPPTLPTDTETGIIPATALNGGNNNDTNFVEIMKTLSTQYLTTPAGNGATVTTPRKVMFIITDGFEDDSITGNRQAFEYSACQQLKNLGYTVYVVYTPYYPLMLVNMFAPWDVPEPWQEMLSSNDSDEFTLKYNLEQCATSPSDYTAANNQSELNAALQGFLKSALNSPASFTN